MRKYETIIYWNEEDRIFVAEVPELAGCMAHGATPEEALSPAGHRAGASTCNVRRRHPDGLTGPMRLTIEGDLAMMLPREHTDNKGTITLVPPPGIEPGTSRSTI